MARDRCARRCRQSALLSTREDVKHPPVFAPSASRKGAARLLILSAEPGTPIEGPIDDNRPEVEENRQPSMWIPVTKNGANIPVRLEQVPTNRGAHCPSRAGLTRVPILLPCLTVDFNPFSSRDGFHRKKGECTRPGLVRRHQPPGVRCEQRSLEIFRIEE